MYTSFVLCIEKERHLHLKAMQEIKCEMYIFVCILS